MKIMICVGSTCHLCGSKKVVTRFQELVEENNVQATVELAGKFCMGKCGEGVCVTVDDVTHIIQKDQADEFFKNEILAKV